MSSADKATQDGFSMGANANASPNPANALQNQNAKTAQNNLPEIGSGTIGISQSGHDKEGYTQNLVGAGITAASTTGTGTQTQDLAQVDVTTKDETRHGINANLDSRVVTDLAHLATTTNYTAVLTDKSGYVGSKLNDISGLSQIGKAGSRVGDSIGDLADSIGTKGVGFLGDYVQTVQTNAVAQAKKAERATLADTQANAADKKAAEQSLANGLTEGRQSVVVNLSDSNQQKNQATQDGKTPTNGKGLSDNNSNNVFINTAQVDMTNAGQQAGEVAHEVIHQQGGDESASQRGQTILDRAVTRENAYDGIVNNSSPAAQQTWYEANKNSPVIQAGSQKIDQVISGKADGGVLTGPAVLEAVLVASLVTTTVVAIKSGKDLGPALATGWEQFKENNAALANTAKTTVKKAATWIGNQYDALTEEDAKPVLNGIPANPINGVTQTSFPVAPRSSVMLDTPAAEMQQQLNGIPGNTVDRSQSQVPGISGGVQQSQILMSEGQTGQRKIVIGENMSDRVIPAAQEIGAQYYKPTSTNPDNWMSNNKQWINREINKGSEFYDVGPDPSRSSGSEYYKMEKSILQKNNIDPIKLDIGGTQK